MANLAQEKKNHVTTEHNIDSHQLYSHQYHHHQQASVPQSPQATLRVLEFFSLGKLSLEDDRDKTMEKSQGMGTNALTFESWFIGPSHLNSLSFHYLIHKIED